MRRSNGRPPVKVLIAGLALLVFMGSTTFSGTSPANAGRVLLGLASAGALGFWFWRARRVRHGTFEFGPTVAVLSRTTLSARSSAALLEADGQRFLVVHGDGFAELTPLPRAGAERLSAPARRPGLHLRSTTSRSPCAR